MDVIELNIPDDVRKYQVTNGICPELKKKSEEYYALRSKISDYDEGAAKINYKIPACTCPHCSNEIPANTEMTPDAMLFMRHQLAALGSM